METLLKNRSPDDNDRYPEEPIKNFPQYMAATAASIVLFVAGTTLGWTSPILPKLMQENATLHVSSDQSTWIGSFVAVGAILGPFPAGVAADLIGTKRALLLSALPYMISWGVLAVAKSVYLIYAGRILAGVSNGWGMALLPMYVGEIATASERGALGVIGQIMITSGFLYVYILGPLLSYVWFNISCSFPPLLFFLLFYFMPETPFHELKKNNTEGAAKHLAKLRGRTTQGVKAELNILRALVEESAKNIGTWSDLFGIKSNRKSVYIMFGLMAIQQFSGINCVLFYSETIFEKAGNALSPELATIVVGLVMFLASFPAPYLIEKLGRRKILLLSTVGMALFLSIIGGFFYMEVKSLDTSKIGWLPLVSIVGYIALYSMGVGPVPWAMIAEMFAASVKSKGASLTTCFSWLMAFFMTKSFGFVVDVLGSHWAFWLFTGFCVLGILFIYFCVPETRGKTLLEIQEMLKGNK